MVKLFFILLNGLLYLGLPTASVCLAQPDRQAVDPSEETLIEGAVVDAQTRRMIVGAVVSIQYSDQTKPFVSQTITDGSFRFRLDPKRSYIIITKASGYNTKEERFAFTSTLPTHLTGKLITLNRASVQGPVSTPAISQSAPTPDNGASSGRADTASATTVPSRTTNIPAPTTLRLEKNVTTELRAIQFVQSTANLLSESQPELDNLLAFMRQHPKVEIELAGHTDNQGDFDKNLELSKQRAEVIKQFLVKNGIVARRIQTRGFGSTRPIASNANEETRRLNRRVEMVIRQM